MEPDLQQIGIGQSPGGPASAQTERTPRQTQLRSSEIQAFQPGQARQQQMSVSVRARQRMPVNVNDTERVVSAALGALLLATAVRGRPLAAMSRGLIGGTLLYRGLSGHCHVYQALHLSSTRQSAAPRDSNVAGTAVQRTVTIDKPAGELYDLWRDPQTLRQVMDFFAEVEAVADGSTHWKVRAPLGKTFEWDSRNVEDRRGERLRWESTANSAFRSIGSISFAEAPHGRGTLVTLTFGFDPPGGRAGQAAAKLLRIVPSTLALRALQRFKSLVETGEIATALPRPSQHERHAHKDSK
jgi:uncharacterized membrane protein